MSFLEYLIEQDKKKAEKRYEKKMKEVNRQKELKRKTTVLKRMLEN